jgi:hypothetical protein
MKPPSPVGNGENYLSFDSHRDLMRVPLILGVGQDTSPGRTQMSVRSTRSKRPSCLDD